MRWPGDYPALAVGLKQCFTIKRANVGKTLKHQSIRVIFA
jgi:hypothetical protein